MVSLASRHLCQLFRAAQAFIKLLALLLRTCILPVRAVLMCKCAKLLNILPFTIRTLSNQLLSQPFTTIKASHDLFSIRAPEYCSMLHTGTSDTLHAAEVEALGMQAREHQVQGLEPHGDGRKDLIFGGIGEHTLFDAVVGEVGVEVNKGGVGKLEVRGHD